MQLLHWLWLGAPRQRGIWHVVPAVQPGPKGSSASESPGILTNQGTIHKVLGKISEASSSQISMGYSSPPALSQSSLCLFLFFFLETVFSCMLSSWASISLLLSMMSQGSPAPEGASTAGTWEASKPQRLYFLWSRLGDSFLDPFRPHGGWIWVGIICRGHLPRARRLRSGTWVASFSWAWWLCQGEARLVDQEPWLCFMPGSRILEPRANSACLRRHPAPLWNYITNFDGYACHYRTLIYMYYMHSYYICIIYYICIMYTYMYIYLCIYI